MRRSFAVAAFALLAAPATAQASHDREADVARMNAIVDAWFPGQPCSGGEGVVMDPNLPGDRDGEARGLDWMHDGRDGWKLFIKTCEQAVRPGLSLARECWIRWHERAHLVYRQVEHTGDLDYSHAGPPDCQYLDHKPPRGPSRRTKLVEAIRGALPGSYGPWAVTCTPNARVMRCRAESPFAKHTRRFAASIDGAYRRVK